MSGERSVYDALAAEFDHTFTDTRAGLELTYITGEQAISRLNDVLGPFGWSFEILDHGYVEVTDEEWVRGRLTAHWDGQTAIREQFGSQKRNKKRDGTVIEVGMDLKGAATDAMKKCASLLGVGLYLSRKEAPANAPRNGTARRQTPARPAAPAPAAAEMVVSTREPLIQRYATLLEELAAAGGDVAPWRIELPVPVADLTKVGKDLAAEIKRVRQPV